MNGLKGIKTRNFKMAEHPSYLIHYASPYYDPVKAHEYYMEHRELKGRRPSTAGLNDTGKEAASYIKKQLYEERDSKIKSHRESTDSSVKSRQEQNESEIKSDTENTRNEIAIHSKNMASRIERLRELFSRMDSNSRSRSKDQLASKIASLRAENQKQREKLNNELKARNFERRESAKSDIEGLRETHKDYQTSTKEEYDEKYRQEIESLLKDSAYTKAKKSGRSSKSSSNTTIRQPSAAWKAYAAERDAKRKADIEAKRKLRK